MLRPIADQHQQLARSLSERSIDRDATVRILMVDVVSGLILAHRQGQRLIVGNVQGVPERKVRGTKKENQVCGLARQPSQAKDADQNEKAGGGSQVVVLESRKQVGAEREQSQC